MIIEEKNKEIPKERRQSFAFLGIERPDHVAARGQVGQTDVLRRDRRVVNLVHKSSRGAGYRNPREHGSVVRVGEVKGMIMLKGGGGGKRDGGEPHKILIKRGRGSYSGTRIVADDKIHFYGTRFISVNVFKANNKTMFPVWQIKSC